MFKDQAIRIVVNKPCHIVRDKAYDINREIIEYDEELVKEKETELQAEYDALQYQRDREPNYPRLAEQFDLLWHAIDTDTLDKTSDFYTTLKAVKDAHPKG